MKEENIELINGCCEIIICINYDANGINIDDNPINPDSVTYNIKDNKLWTWDNREVMSFDDIDDSEWDDIIADEECSESSWFECFITNIMAIIWDDDLPGSVEFHGWFDKDLTLGALLKDKNDDIIDETWKIKLTDFL